MATRKKKTETQEPTVVKGTHLTVTTFPDGSTVLEWDDEQLLNEVREALASVTPASKKSKKFNFSEPKEIVTEDGSVKLEVRVTKKAVPKKAKVEEPKTKRKSKEK